MTTEEFDAALTELETRVDRLRALYENWFRGYEKAEPSVARKDVERRVYQLRKALPRNTALRFRYHQLYQRYTTLASYWQRTARQIEEGTYKLQLTRLKRRNERLKRPAPRGDEGTRDEDDSPLESPEYELSLDESLNVADLLDELELDEVARALEAPAPQRPPQQAPQPPPFKATQTATFAKPPRSGRPPAPGAPPPKPAAAPAAALPPAPPARPAAAPPAIPKASPLGPPVGPVARPEPPRTPALAGSPPGSRVAPPPPRPGPPLPAPIAGSNTKVGRPPLASPIAGSSAPTEQRMKGIYDEYLAARRRNNEGEIRYEAMVHGIHKMLPELAKKHQGKQIDFEVVVKDGRVGLKPKAT